MPCCSSRVCGGGGYPLVNVTCLSATLPLVNCSDYYCDNVAIKQEALRRGEGLMVREMDVHRLRGGGECIKVAIHSDPSPPPPIITTLISGPDQYACAAAKKDVNQRAASEKNQKALTRRHQSTGSVQSRMIISYTRGPGGRVLIHTFNLSILSIPHHICCNLITGNNMIWFSLNSCVNKNHVSLSSCNISFYVWIKPSAEIWF